VSPRLFQHDLVDSTNERALAAIADGTARHGDVHVAEGQSAGRGRLGRTWASASGEGLYVSLVLLPSSPPNPAALTMGAGLAVLESVRALGARDACLKWPNDVLVGGAKLAGILVESRGLDPARPHAVVGVGVNVLQRAFPPELLAERAVTSLALLGCMATCEEALDVLRGHLGPRLELACRSPERVASDFASASQLVGHHVRIRHGRGEERGRLARLDLSGLELARDDGERVRIALEHAQAVELDLARSI
jgi:BirA family biotin operon repressor/biotin-[acetyl-CoA-carboxylase] ligase